MLLTHANLFTPVDLKHRIFTKVPKPSMRDRLLVLAQAGDMEPNNHMVRQVRLRDMTFEVAEELQTLNTELRLRADQLNRANIFLQTILASLRAAAIVVDHNLRVLIWSHRAEALWGLRADEAQG